MTTRAPIASAATVIAARDHVSSGLRTVAGCRARQREKCRQ
jgi:hypothetical protein